MEKAGSSRFQMSTAIRVLNPAAKLLDLKQAIDDAL
jgi:hypothetical protein